MDGDTEASLDDLGRGLPGVGLLCPPALDEVEDLVAALVGALGAVWLRQKPGNAVGFKGPRRRVEGLAAGPEGDRHLGDGTSRDAVAPQHLVFHLETIAPVEELLGREGLVMDGLGVRMEGARGAQRGDLGVLRARCGATGHPCHYYYVQYRADVKRLSRVWQVFYGILAPTTQGRISVMDIIAVTRWMKYP